MADQICYAVLCVFSYFAAGQEQKKVILEQAARIQPAPGPPAAPARNPEPDAAHAQPKPASQVDRRPSDNIIRTGEVTERQRLPPDRQPRVLPERPRLLPEQPARAETRESAESEESGRAESAERSERAESGHSAAQRTESLPPRRPPPPQPRLARAHSQACPPRPHEPPTIPPRVGANPRAGPPPALPPRQMSAAADISTSPRGSASSSPVRRGGLSRQGSVTTPGAAPFAPSNPFTASRHAEFVIPQRNNARRPSADRS